MRSECVQPPQRWRAARLRAATMVAAGVAGLAGCASPPPDAPTCPGAEVVSQAAARYAAMQPEPNPPADLTAAGAACGQAKFVRALQPALGSVVPSLVFELGFEGLNASPRHKSGIAVRFPRMLRIRDDKPLHEADSLQTLEAMLHGLDLRPAPTRGER